MEEEKKVVAEEAVAEPVKEEKTEAPRRGGYEPHGSVSAPRPGDRKYGDHKGKPSERRNGRGGFKLDKDDYLERVVAINRISKTVTGGKHMRFSALAVVGDGKGKYGFANCKSGEVPDAIKKALDKARKHMLSITLVKGTISHDVVGKFGSTKVVLKPAKPGTGIVAGGPVRAIVELAGIKNVVSKVYGSRAPINIIRAVSNGLQSLKNYETVMVLRGKKTAEEIKAIKEKEAPKAAKKVVKEEKVEKGENK